MADDDDLLIHHLIDSVQRSIDIADRTSRKKYNFSLARMNVKMTLDFEIKSDSSKSKSQSSGPKHWLALFSRKNNPLLNNTQGDAEDRHGSLTVSMLFRPGGKAIVSANSDDDDDDMDSDTSDNSSSSDSDSSDDDNF